MRNNRQRNRVNAQLKLNAEEKIETVMKVVAKFKDLSEDFYAVKSRKREIVLARQMACFLLRDVDPTITYNLIAHFTGQNHATVIHAVETFANLVASDKDIQKQYETLKEMFNTRYMASDLENGRKINVYTVNINNCITIKINEQKSIVLSGYTQDQAEMIGAICSENETPVKPVKHTNTGIVLIGDTG